MPIRRSVPGGSRTLFAVRQRNRGLRRARRDQLRTEFFTRAYRHERSESAERAAIRAQSRREALLAMSDPLLGSILRAPSQYPAAAEPPARLRSFRRFPSSWAGYSGRRR